MKYLIKLHRELRLVLIYFKFKSSNNSYLSFSSTFVYKDNLKKGTEGREDQGKAVM